MIDTDNHTPDNVRYQCCNPRYIVYEVADDTEAGIWVSITSCICGTPWEDSGVESVVGDDGIAVGSLEVVSRVLPDTWGPVSDESLLTGSSRIGLKAYGFWAMVIIGCSKPGGGSEVEQGSEVRGEFVPANSCDDTVTLDLDSLRMHSRIHPRIP